ncbi:hypothetical protein K1719_043338 [Acacia pycnantha]|nr:hypothetical protein K1719_043338 [Acacia pycnantha]
MITRCFSLLCQRNINKVILMNIRLISPFLAAPPQWIRWPVTLRHVKYYPSDSVEFKRFLDHLGFER